MGLQGWSDHRRIFCPVLHTGWPWPPRDRRSGLQPDAEQRLHAALPAWPPGFLRTCRARLPDAAGRVQPYVLHQFRIGVGGHGDQDHSRLPAGPRPGAAQSPDQPRARLSRRQYGRRLACRHGPQPRDLRPDASEHLDDPPHLDRGAALLEGPAADRCRDGHGPRAHRREPWRLHPRRCLHRARRRFHRHAGAAGRLSGKGPRDL